ncbi:MAG: hypothetical protein ACPGVO_07100, partial [Spirulinaceae cyanobacterium]
QHAMAVAFEVFDLDFGDHGTGRGWVSLILAGRSLPPKISLLKAQLPRPHRQPFLALSIFPIFQNSQ